MSPSHANKRGIRYRYYVSQALLQGRPVEAGSVARVAAPDLESIILKGLREHLASAARLGLPAPQPPTATLEVSLAQNGLPVRTVVTEHDQGTVISATVEIPAINFPLVIEPPPASQTITIRELRQLERQARKHSHHRARG